MQRDRSFFLASSSAVDNSTAEANTQTSNPASPDRDSRKPRALFLDSAMQATQHAAASAQQAAAQAAAHARAVYAFDWVDWAGLSPGPEGEGSGGSLVEQSATPAEDGLLPERLPRRSALKGAREADRARETAARANAAASHPNAASSSYSSSTTTRTAATATGSSKEAAVAAAEALEAARAATMAAKAAAAISSLRPPGDAGLSSSESVFGNSSIISSGSRSSSSSNFDFAEYDHSDTMTANAAHRLAQQSRKVSATSGGAKRSTEDNDIGNDRKGSSEVEEEEDAATRAAALMRFRRGQCYEHGLGGVNKSIKVAAEEYRAASILGSAPATAALARLKRAPQGVSFSDNVDVKVYVIGSPPLHQGKLFHPGSQSIALRLDAFLARRPRPTYSALSREGKGGLLSVLPYFIRHRPRSGSGSLSGGGSGDERDGENDESRGERGDDSDREYPSPSSHTGTPNRVRRRSRVRRARNRQPKPLTPSSLPRTAAGEEDEGDEVPEAGEGPKSTLTTSERGKLGQSAFPAHSFASLASAFRPSDQQQQQPRTFPFASFSSAFRSQRSSSFQSSHSDDSSGGGMSDGGGIISDENDEENGVGDVHSSRGGGGVSVSGNNEGMMRGFGTAASTAESAERWWRQQRAKRMAWWKHLVKSAKEAQSQDDDDGHFSESDDNSDKSGFGSDTALSDRSLSPSGVPRPLAVPMPSTSATSSLPFASSRSRHSVAAFDLSSGTSSSSATSGTAAAAAGGTSSTSAAPFYASAPLKRFLGQLVGLLFALLSTPFKMLWQLRPKVVNISCPVWLQPFRMHLFFLEMDVREAFHRWVEPQHNGRAIILGVGTAVTASVLAVYLSPREL